MATPRIPQKTAREIATLVNNMESAMIMYRSSTEKKDYDWAARWLDQRGRAVVKLADTFGIILPTLDGDRARLLDRQAQRAA